MWKRSNYQILLHNECKKCMTSFSSYFSFVMHSIHVISKLFIPRYWLCCKWWLAAFQKNWFFFSQIWRASRGFNTSNISNTQQLLFMTYPKSIEKTRMHWALLINVMALCFELTYGHKTNWNINSLHWNLPILWTFFTGNFESPIKNFEIWEKIYEVQVVAVVRNGCQLLHFLIQNGLWLMVFVIIFRLVLLKPCYHSFLW